jgi:hypothetical protein
MRIEAPRAVAALLLFAVVLAAQFTVVPTNSKIKDLPGLINGNLVSCGGTDDTAALTAASSANITYYLLGTCVVTHIRFTTDNFTWMGAKAVIKHKAADTTVMLDFAGANTRLVGLKFDMNGQAQSSGAGTCNANAFICFEGANFSMEDSIATNSGTGQAVWGIETSGGTGLIRHVTLDSTLYSNKILIYNTPAHGTVEIASCYIDGKSGQDNNGIVAEFTDVASMVDIHDTTIVNQYSVTGQGPNGNGVNPFQLGGRAHVHHNYFYNMTYSGVRVDQSSNVSVDSNTIDNPPNATMGEGAIYCAEGGGDGCTVTNNQISNYQTGISDTNIPVTGSRVHPSHFSGNHIFNMSAACMHVENAMAMGNTCDNTPIGVTVGFGNTGYGNLVAMNQFNNVPVHIAVEAALFATPNNQVGGSLVNNGSVTPTARVVPMQISAGCGISGITQANPAVISWNTCTQPVVNQVYLINAVYGMSQINGKLCQVSATNATTMTCGGGTFPINSSVYSAFAAPAGGQGGTHADLVYSTGTTLQYSVPSTVVALQ